MQPQAMTAACAQCGTPVSITVRTIIDVATDPQGKALLLSDQLNAVRCPACGAVNRMAGPILYHDASKELLIAMVPMELNAPKHEHEKLIGDMLNRLTAQIPKEKFRAYMFNPRRALTMNGLVEQILEADGIAPETLEAQRKRMELLQRMLAVNSESAIYQLIEQHDADIDVPFFQTLTLLIQRTLSDDREDVARAMMGLQSLLLERTTAGQKLMADQAAQEAVVQEIAATIQALGPGATREDFRQLAMQYRGDDASLEALVGLARPAFDYQFFQEFTVAIGSEPAADRPALEALRERLVTLTEAVDQQVQAQTQAVVNFLRQVLAQPNPAEALAQNAEAIDDTFMSVLLANINEARRRNDPEMLSRLESLYETAAEILQSQMAPELQFINALLSAPDDATAGALLAEQAEQYGPVLHALVAEVEQVLQSQGHQDGLRRLRWLRQELDRILPND